LRALIFGATGMIGQGVLRECLRDSRVAEVVTVGRTATGQQHPKLRQIVHADLLNLSAIAPQFDTVDACFWCLGVSSAGMKEADYRRVTLEMPLAAATMLVARNPGMTFIYVSGTGADSSGQGRIMWARVKGQAENALAELPFKAVYIFRPGFVQPLHGIQSRTALYNAIYRLLGPLYPVLKRIAPGAATTTEQIGRAMLNVAESGASRRVLENPDINQL
jgi:uncharacterized protein YbjT (DUF2867 family)